MKPKLLRAFRRGLLKVAGTTGIKKWYRLCGEKGLTKTKIFSTNIRTDKLELINVESMQLWYTYIHCTICARKIDNENKIVLLWDSKFQRKKS